MTTPPSRTRLIEIVAERTAAADRTESAADLAAVEQALQALLDVVRPDDPIRPRTLATSARSGVGSGRSAAVRRA